MTKQIRQIGILLRKINRHGTLYIEASLCSREGDSHEPRGVSDSPINYDLPAHLRGLALDGLGIFGFVSEYRDRDGDELCPFIGNTVEFHDVFCVDQDRAGRMLKTLKRVNARIEKDRAFEPGDKFAALASALKLDFVIEDREPNLPRSGVRYVAWTVAEGRNRYRELIEEARRAETERRFPRARAS